MFRVICVPLVDGSGLDALGPPAPTQPLSVPAIKTTTANNPLGTEIIISPPSDLTARQCDLLPCLVKRRKSPPERASEAASGIGEHWLTPEFRHSGSGEDLCSTSV
jgi:hypothetical protein